MKHELTLEQVLAKVIGEMERESETEAIADGIVPETTEVTGSESEHESWWAWERRVMARYGMKGRPAWASKPGEVH